MEREFWMKHAHLVPRARIAASKVLPTALVDHLLSHKSSRAVKQKFGHRITPLQAACHSLVIPIVFPVYMAGVTGYRNGRHVILPLPAGEPPFIVLSALVQPDFEFKNVMYAMIRHENHELVGRELPQDFTDASGDALKSNFIFHFTKERKLAAKHELSKDYLASENCLVHGKDVLSLEMLRNIVAEQIRIEMVALDKLSQDFKIKLVYTWDPPSIFARSIGLDVLDRVWFEAISRPGVLSGSITCIAYNDFANKAMVPELRRVFSGRVQVCAKGDARLRPGEFKVLHTNSDAFGEHIRTQPTHSSLDGAIGASSSAAASLCLREPSAITWI